MRLQTDTSIRTERWAILSAAIRYAARKEKIKVAIQIHLRRFSSPTAAEPP